MIAENYCSFEIAKLLKKKGFNCPCRVVYSPKGIVKHYLKEEVHAYDLKGHKKLCPTHQLAMKWLREVHNICITIYPDKVKGYEAVLYNIKDDVEIILQSFGIYGYHIFEDSYEQACEAALKYALENLI